MHYDLDPEGRSGAPPALRSRRSPKLPSERKLLRRYAAELISSRLRLQLPVRELAYRGVHRQTREAEEVTFDGVAPATEVHEFSDITMVKGEGRLHLILRTRRTIIDHVSVQARDQSSVIEIDLRRPPLDAAALDAFILAASPRAWLVHRHDKACRANIDRQLASCPVTSNSIASPARQQAKALPTTALPHPWVLPAGSGPVQREASLRLLAHTVMGPDGEDWLGERFQNSSSNREDSAARSSSAYAVLCEQLADTWAVDRRGLRRRYRSGDQDAG